MKIRGFEIFHVPKAILQFRHFLYARREVAPE